LDEGIRSLMTGVGIFVAAIALAFFGRPMGASVWWFWLLIPAFALVGKGISYIVRANQLKASESSAPQLPYAPPPVGLSPSRTNELKPPVASVTEGTTRHLGTEAAKQHFDSWEDQKPS
jgi:hypothetical protein